MRRLGWGPASPVGAYTRLLHGLLPLPLYAIRRRWRTSCPGQSLCQHDVLPGVYLGTATGGAAVATILQACFVELQHQHMIEAAIAMMPSSARSMQLQKAQQGLSDEDQAAATCMALKPRLCMRNLTCNHPACSAHGAVLWWLKAARPTAKRLSLTITKCWNSTVKHASITQLPAPIERVHMTAP